MRALILFDIDGTLLSSASAGKTAILRALADEYEDVDFIDSVRFDGKTDPQIVRELHIAAGRPDRVSDVATAELLDRYLSYLGETLAARADQVSTMPGVHELLDALAAEVDVCVGLLTGNVKTGARMKLEAAGIPFDSFELGAFGSDSGHRPELPQFAIDRAFDLYGRVPVGQEVVIIGDTPADVTCGQSLGVRSIAVATGSYSVDELNAAGAHSSFATLEVTEEVLSTIMAPAIA